VSSRTSAGRKHISKNLNKTTFTCSAKLSDGSPCPKVVKGKQKYCYWHDPEDKSWYGIYSLVNRTTLEEKTDVVLFLIDDHPDHKLILPARENYPFNLNSVDLSQRTFQKKRPQAKSQGSFSIDETPSLRKANLQGAYLRYANLRGASLEDANLKDAFLSDAVLIDAHLKNANLQGAFFKGADLRKADFSFADLQDAYFDEKTNFKDTILYKTNFEGVHAYDVKLSNKDLEGINLKNAELGGANLQGAKLNYAKLQKAFLGGANLIDAKLFASNLNGAKLEGAKLHRANLVFAKLKNVVGDKANFRKANLTETTFNKNSSFEGAHFEEAWLNKANLKGVRLDNAFLNSAHLEYAILQDADLSGAELPNSKLINANLQNANLQNANLQNANLKGANLQGAKLWNANLQGANLRDTQLQGVDLTEVEDISNVYLSGVWLEKTRIWKEQLGKYIREEQEKDYTSAKRSYLALKQNFESLGDYGAASWAYCKEKDMQMFEAWEKKEYAKSFRNFVFKWSCNYGEGFLHVIFWIVIFLLIVAPSFFHLLSYQFIWSHDQAHEYQKLSYWAGRCFIYRLDILYTLDTLTTATFSNLKPNSFLTTLASGLFAMLGVFLFGLLGFVAGNRIRRS